MVLGGRPNYQKKRILDLSLLFTIKNVTSGYTLCHLENCFFLLYVYFRIVTWKKTELEYRENWKRIGSQKKTPLRILKVHKTRN